jgi:MFS family permease
VILPWSAGAFVTGLVSGRLAARFGSRRALVAGSLIALAPSALLATMNDSVFWICVAMGAVGTGTGLVTAAMPAILVSHVPIEQTGVAAGMNQNIRTIGGAVGAQLLSAVISSSGAPKESLYVVSFLIVGGVCLFGLLASLAVPGDRTPGRTRPAQAAGAVG